MDIFIWLIVGMVAGGLASLVMRGSGFGLVGEIALGAVGAVVGAATFSWLGWQAPFSGLAGAIVVAFVGAVVVLSILRLAKHALTTPAPA